MHESHTWNWTALLDAVTNRFPAATATDILAFDGDTEALLRFLAQANELTLAEARDQLALTSLAIDNNATDLRAA